MLFRITFFLLGFLGCTLASAQPYSSPMGAFQVSEIKGCAPLTITIKPLLHAPNCACDYVVGTTSIGQVPSGMPIGSLNHTFTQPGTYILNGYAQAPAVPDKITITVTPNVAPAFEISNCTSGKVSIKITDTQYNQYLVDFNNDNVIDNTIASNQTAMYNYGVASPETIKVRGQDFNGALNCTVNSQSFNTVTALPAATISTLTVADGTTIDLDYTPDISIQYRAQVATNNTTNFQLFQAFNSASTAPQTLTLNNLATDDNYYCFRLNAYDPCNNTSVSSNTICSANFDLNIVSDINKLNWVTSNTGVTDFTIKRDLVNYQVVTGNSYNDAAPAITCNTDYTYSLVTNYANGSSSISLDKTGRSFTTTIPSIIDNTTAVVGENLVDLSWVQNPAFTAQTYSITRSASSGPFSLIGNSATTDYTDATYSTSGNFCYMISYTDVCANNSPDGTTVCPVQLTGILGSNNEVHLSWSAYLGWKKGVVRYYVDKYDYQGTFIKTFTTTNTTLNDNEKDPDNQVVEYVVRAEPKDVTLSESVSNRLKITRQAKLLFPTAFTPNRDNLNEKFTVKGQYVENMSLQIFDRWGTLLFSTQTYEPWDGTYNGQIMPESTYIWKALITDKTGNTFNKVGSVALLKPGK